MYFQKGCRLKVSNLSQLNKLLTSFRNQAVKILAETYAEQIAVSAISDLDEHKVGLNRHNGDFLKTAIEGVKKAHDTYQDSVYAPELNCCIEFYFIRNAILAHMTHGSVHFEKAWVSRPEVVKWGWSAKNNKPSHITTKSWNERAILWQDASKIQATKLGLIKFSLIEDHIPNIGWRTIKKFSPNYEVRIENCVKKLMVSNGLNMKSNSSKELKEIEDEVRKNLNKSITRESFTNKPTVKKPIQRNTQKKAKVVGLSNRRKKLSKAFIDHADIVVASDGRAFIAVPHVMFRKEDRVYVQVGSKDVTFLQNGILYGTVRDISTDARDYLRGLTTITLVEVGEENGRRLLRAKHTSMVNDISLSEGLRRPLQKFRRKSRENEIQET